MAGCIDLMLKHRGSGSAEEWANFCVLVKGVSAPRKAPRDPCVSLSDPTIARLARCLCDRGFIALEGVAHNSD